MAPRTNPTPEDAHELRLAQPAGYTEGQAAAVLDLGESYAVSEREARRRYLAAWAAAQDPRTREPAASARTAAFWLGYVDQLVTHWGLARAGA